MKFTFFISYLMLFLSLEEIVIHDFQYDANHRGGNTSEKKLKGQNQRKEILFKTISLATISLHIILFLQTYGATCFSGFSFSLSFPHFLCLPSIQTSILASRICFAILASLTKLLQDASFSLATHFCLQSTFIYHP